MRWVDEGGVGQCEQFGVHGLVEVAGEAVGVAAYGGEQVRSPDVTDEQGVAGQHGPRLGVRLPSYDDRDRLGCVAGCVAYLESDLAERQDLSVGERFDIEVGSGDRAVGDHRPGRVGEFKVAGEGVGVEVGFDDPFDRKAVDVGVGHVFADVALGVDDHGAAGGGVADHVAVQRQAGEVVLAEVHRAPRFSG